MIDLALDLMPEPGTKFSDEEKRKDVPRKIVFVIAVLLQFLVLTGLLAAKAYTAHTGQVIRLAATPQYAHDLFDGNFVNLQYDISRQRISEIVKRGTEAYVVLQKEEPAWTVARVTTIKPKLSSNEVFLRAKVEHVNPYDSSSTKTYDAQLRYGIERFFVPKGSSLEYDVNKSDGQRYIVEVVVDDMCGATVKRVLLNNKEVRLN